MTNSVGTVTIDLEARIAQFESDLGRAARVAEQRADDIKKTLGSILGVLGVGISIAGITEFLKTSIDAQDAMSKLSQKVAVSTETLSGWELASKQAGVESDALQKGLVKLGQAAAASADGGKEQAAAFKALGVSVTDASGHLKPMQTLFEDVAQSISKYGDSTEKTVIATKLFGKAGADLIPLLDAGKEGLANYIKLADDFGLTVGSTSAKAAEEFNDHLEQLGFISKGVANTLVTALAPALADLTVKAVGFFRSKTWKTTLNDISVGAKAVADHMGDIITAVKLLGELVAITYAQKIISSGLSWIANLTAQGVAVDALGAKTVLTLGQTVKNIGLVQTTFNLLGAAVAGWEIGTYLYNQFEIVRDAGAVLVGTLLVGWEKIKEGAQLAWLAVSDAWLEALGTMHSAFNTFETGIATILQHSLLPSVRQAGDQMAAELAKSAQSNATQLEASLTKDALDRMKIREDANKKIADIRSNTWSGVGVKNNNGTDDHSLDGLKPPSAKPTLTLVPTSTAAADAYKAAVKAIQDRIAADRESLAVGTQVTEAEKARAKLIQDITDGTLKVTPAQKAYLLQLSATDIELQKSIQLDKQKQQGISNILSLTEKLSAGLKSQSDQNDIANIGVSHGSDVTQQLQAELEIRQKYQAEITALNRNASKPENVGTANGIGGQYYNIQLAEIAGFQTQSTALYEQGIADRKKLEADGWNGTKAAMEDFMTTQQNVAAETKEFTTSALTGFSSAFDQFVSGTETAKKAFGSLIDSMFQMALKFVTDKTMQAFFDSFGLSGSAQTPGTSAGGFGSLLGNLGSVFGFGGGSGAASSPIADLGGNSGSWASDLSSVGGGSFNLAGGLAVGGAVTPNSLYRVNENGPELYSQGGNTYLMGGSQAGKVTPIRAGGGSSVTNVQVMVQPTTTRRTADQVATQTARIQRVASSRNG